MPTLVNNLRAIRGPVTAVPMVGQSGVVVEPDNVNNQVIVRADETVLWEGTQLAGNTVTLSESAANFEYLGVYVSIEGTGLTAPMFYKCMQRNSDPYGTVIRAGGDVCKSITSQEYQLYTWGGEVAIKGTSCQIGNFYRFHFNGGGLVDSTSLVRMHRVVGINRIANN
jgi:hypothetical protein